MAQSRILELSRCRVESGIGGKARGLLELHLQGAKIPKTWVCLADSQAGDGSQDLDLSALRLELDAKLDTSKTYIVRSSADVEDSPEASFAGQFETVPGVRGTGATIEAIRTVWESASNPKVEAYRASRNLDRSRIKMAVLIQEMVPPVVSGVAFSRNPLTGFDEVIVESVVGSGERLVQKGVTPDRWVSKWGKWVTAPDNADPSARKAAEIAVSQAREIETRYGAPADLEWVFDGSDITWLQLRPISALQSVNVYSNRIAREVLPGTILPLIWSVNVPLVNGVWIGLFTELIGSNDLRPEQLSKAFHHRAYFNMGVIGTVFRELGMPKDILEVMMGLEGGDEKPRFRPSRRIARHIPRLLRFALDKLRYEKRIRKAIPEFRSEFDQFPRELSPDEPASHILSFIESLDRVVRKAAHANIVTPILMSIYNKNLEKRLSETGIDFTTFSVTAGMRELADLDPTPHINRLRSEFAVLPEPTRSAIKTNGYSALPDLPEALTFHRSLDAFLETFGHLSESGNDFSKVPWREDPSIVLSMIESAADSPNRQPLTWDSVPPHYQKRLKKPYEKARRFQYYREAVSSVYTRGYGLFRVYYLTLAKQFVGQHVIEQEEDIFYLESQEVRNLVHGKLSAADARERVRERRASVERSRGIRLPEIIYGDQPPPLESQEGERRSLRGLATSHGYYRGPVRVIHSEQDFEKMIDGAVAVIPFSDVAWTPLLSRAGAVVSESGGLLSHSSIVAREYGLPAVVSVTDACCVLQDNLEVLVDGVEGMVTILEEAEKA